MRPLIFEFAETPELQTMDYSLIEYSNKENLSLVKGTNLPAILYANLDTQTFTKSGTEPSDSDKQMQFQISQLLDTSTRTLTSREQSDTDRDRSLLNRLMDTQTVTESIETTDSDK